MKKSLAVVALTLAVALLTHTVLAQKPSPSPVSQALEMEMARAFQLLKQKGNPAPYFISYSVRENDSLDIEASLGSLRSSQKDRSRLLDVDVRVGDYGLDSTHQIRGQPRANTGPAFSYPVLMPIHNDVDALRSVIGPETDQNYKAAVERFIQVKANRTIKVDEEDTSADMSRETNQSTALPLAKMDPSAEPWEKRVKALSAIFSKYPEI